MYLNIMNNKKTGKTRLSIRRGYRDANGKVKNVTTDFKHFFIVKNFVSIQNA